MLMSRWWDAWAAPVEPRKRFPDPEELVLVLVARGARGFPQLSLRLLEGKAGCCGSPGLTGELTCSGMDVLWKPERRLTEVAAVLLLNAAPAILEASVTPCEALLGLEKALLNVLLLAALLAAVTFGPKSGLEQLLTKLPPWPHRPAAVVPPIRARWCTLLCFSVGKPAPVPPPPPPSAPPLRWRPRFLRNQRKTFS
jgi:hypothetical protein